MKRTCIVLCVLLLCLLCGCTNTPDTPDSQGATEYFANYYYGYADDVELSSGKGAQGDKLYLIQKITVGSVITEPQAPTRTGYLFDGWYTDRTLTNPYDFAEVATKSVTLYAKWVRDGGNDDGNDKGYVDAGLSFTESTHASGDALVWTKVLNSSIIDGAVYLTTGGILRLEQNANDVKWLLEYSKLSATNVVSATYDKTTKTITVSYENNGNQDSLVCTVVDNSNEYKLANATYEAKASAYEANGAAQTDYKIMLAGSSSMEYWTTSEQDMYPLLSINHGIGGTSAIQWRDDLAERLIYPYNPRAVVLYVGVNDIINNGQSGEATGNAVVQLMRQIHNRLPSATVYYVLINSLPGYASFQSEFDSSNRIVAELAELNDWAHVIDAGAGFIKDSGYPSSAYFRTDGLHMSTYGYTLWGQAIKDYVFEVEQRLYR